jgi:hypothetical protein
MRKLRALLLLPALLLAVLAAPTASRAEDMTFQVKSMSQDVVQIAFFSQDRRVRWPAPGRAYGLADYNEHDYKLGCINGEKVCYGAWVKGNSNRYWGVGAEGKHSCVGCCYTCNGRETKHIVLRSPVSR